jgi:hypothetical protein
MIKSRVSIGVLGLVVGFWAWGCAKDDICQLKNADGQSPCEGSGETEAGNRFPVVQVPSC